MLIFQEAKGPRTGLTEDADPAHRHPVRLIKDPVLGVDPLTQEPISEIEWHPEDALPFPLCLSAKMDREHGEADVEEVSVALGNIALADHGQTLDNPERLDAVPMPHLSRVPAGAHASSTELPRNAEAPGAQAQQLIPPRYRPILRGRPLTHADAISLPRRGRLASFCGGAMQYARETVRPSIESLVRALNGVEKKWRPA